MQERTRNGHVRRLPPIGYFPLRGHNSRMSGNTIMLQ
jgi:hypothetical protein